MKMAFQEKKTKLKINKNNKLKRIYQKKVLKIQTS